MTQLVHVYFTLFKYFCALRVYTWMYVCKYVSMYVCMYAGPTIYSGAVSSNRKNFDLFLSGYLNFP